MHIILFCLFTVNFPPTINGPTTFQVNIGEESIYTFNATDEGDTFIVTVMGGLPEGSALEEDGGIYMFRWTLMDPNIVISLAFLATDSEGASASLNPRVEICNCQNNGNCTVGGVENLDNTTILLNCECLDGKEGGF